MDRSLPAALLAAWLACASPVFVHAAAPESLTRARALLERDDPKAAAELLESALPATPSADRAALLKLLREAYESAVRQAERAGRPAEAELYRENLAILNRKPRPAPAPAAPATAPALTVLPRTSAPEDPAIQRTGVAAEKPERPTPAEPAAAEPAPALAAPAAADTPAGREADAGAKSRIAQANAAFKDKDYEGAGRMYGALARENQLPKEYLNHLAYCCCVEVVKRINARPTTAEEWDEIDAEIARIREMSPKLWFSDYLRNLAAERSKGVNRTKSNKVIVRGAAPEEPSEPPAPKPQAARGTWQVHETASFRIFHDDPALAERVADVAERTRESQIRRWSGTPPREPWVPKCDIYLYPTAQIFSAMTGQPQESPGFSTMGLDAGRINCRRVNLRADHPKIVAAILPHEVTHVVLADFFSRKQIPRWADEGMAVLAEPRGEQTLRAADLHEPLASGKLFRMADLMSMDYPSAEHWALYYAQSVSLTRFLVEAGTAAQFIDFVQGCQQRGHEEELRRVYQIDGFAELERRWLQFAKAQSTTAGVTADSTKKDADTASR